MRVLLNTTSNSGLGFYDKSAVNNYINKLKSIRATKEEYTDSFGYKYWYIYVEIKDLYDVKLIQGVFDEELIIDFRGKEPFIEVYDGSRE